ncbi:MAG TPA: NYN domain-containing protein [Bacillota bacterium]|nr:NYN domain-containing protein [Bacillota bacterium]
MHDTKKRLSAMVYMDYENILEFLQPYGKTLLEMNFFTVVLTKFKQAGLKIIDFTIYGNFERGFTRSKQQTYLRSLGLQTRQSSSNGKNNSDLELTVDTIRTLYKTSGVDVFIIIISGRDIIPLLKAIRLEGKLSYLLSTKNSFNQIIAEYADLSESLEDIFGLNPVEPKPLVLDQGFDPAPLTGGPFSGTACTGPACTGPAYSGPAYSGAAYSGAAVERAKEVAKMFYTSQIWRRAVQLNEPVNLTGYAQAITKAFRGHSGDILDSFKLAHALQFITIYYGPNQKLFIKEGAKKEECV